MIDEAVEMQDDRGQWFVVQTLSGHENKVRDTINRQLRMGDSVPVYEAMIPVERVMEIRRGKKVQVTRKFFPGYILVRMDLYDEEGRIDEKAWYFVRSVQGVLGFLGGENRPTALTPEEFRDMNPTLGEDAPSPRWSSEPGSEILSASKMVRLWVMRATSRRLMRPAAV